MRPFVGAGNHISQSFTRPFLRAPGDRYAMDKRVGRGGMAAKVDAARFALDHGVPSVICNGHDPEILSKIVQGLLTQQDTHHAGTSDPDDSQHSRQDAAC